MITFTQPYFLLLSIPLVAAAYKFSWLKLHSPVRCVLSVLLILAVAQPVIVWQSPDLDLFLLTDTSDSVDFAHRRVEEIQYLLEKSRPPGSTLRKFNFSGEVVDSSISGYSVSSMETAQSKLGRALKHTLQLAQNSKAARIFVVTDGYSTDSLAFLAEQASKSSVPIDYRILLHPETTDFTIENLNFPKQINEGSGFLLSGKVVGNRESKAEIELVRDGRLLGTIPVAIKNKQGDFEVQIEQSSAGSHEYELRLKAEGDQIDGNNTRKFWQRVVGKPRHLLLSTSGKQDPLIPLLEKLGFELLVPLAPRDVTVGDLQSVESVIFNNVSVLEIPRTFLESLDFFVKEQGGGLLVLGGRDSFASGGYISSPIEAILPVHLKTPQEYRAFNSAVGIVMDTSGSMGAMASGSGVAKMNLANEGASRAVHYLKEDDYISVLAVDSEPHEIVPLIEVGPSRSSIEGSIQSITSGGGGIYVYKGLEAIWKQLKKAESKNKHILLFADAADAEVPGDYETLINEMRTSDTTVSVIGLGSEVDTDAELLKHIAELGGGAMIFCDNPDNLPDIFAQDIAAFTQRSFIEEPAALLPGGYWQQISRTKLEWPLQIDSYNISFLKKGAHSLADLEAAAPMPLVATWNYGAGKAATVALDIEGSTAKSWSETPTLLQGLLTWLKKAQALAGTALTARVEGTTAFIAFEYDKSWNEQAARTLPKALIVSNKRGIQEFQWNKSGPGKLELQIELEENELIQGAVTLGDNRLTIPLTGRQDTSEWDFDSHKIRQLRQISLLSGGNEITNLKEVWEKKSNDDDISLLPLLLWLILVLILIDAYLSQIAVTPKWPLLPLGRTENKNQ